MIARTSSHLLGWWAARRRRALERAWARPAAVQEECLLALVSAARDTEFGVGHGFDRIRSVAEYVERVPLRGYPEFQPLWERALWGERDVTWPGEVRHWVTTSGTTAGDKLIPMTREAMAAQWRAGRDALLLAVERVGAESLMGGPLLFLGRQHRAPAGGRARADRRPLRASASVGCRRGSARGRRRARPRHPGLGHAHREHRAPGRRAGPSPPRRHAVLGSSSSSSGWRGRARRRGGPSATCSTAGRTSGSTSMAASRSLPTRRCSRSGSAGRSSASRCIRPPRGGWPSRRRRTAGSP